MTFSDPAFWIALLQIIGVNIVLSGDNAVVIALAARSLPPKQQKQAVLWGSRRYLAGTWKIAESSRQFALETAG